MLRHLFGFPVELQSCPDLRFVLRYGPVFSVTAHPESGCLAFGVDNLQHGRLLIRYAGAGLPGGPSPAEAIRRLQHAMPVYERLYTHPALIRLQGHGPAADGYAAIFLLPNGVPMEGAVLEQALRLPLLSRLRMIDRIFDFHAFAAAQGVLSVGFSLPALWADCATAEITLADIDLYRPLPSRNDWGRMPGNSRFLSPEEYELGAPLDTWTMQYTMGALAFALFAGHADRERGAWTAGEALYQVASRACSEERGDRYPSYDAFLLAWRAAAGETVP